MYTIRYALVDDKEFYLSLDSALTLEEYIQKIKTQTIYIMEYDNVPIGILRYNLFWDQIPFLNLIHIKEESQKKGYGSILINTWEQKMMQLGHTSVMTSSSSNEGSHKFYDIHGYRIIGDFTIENQEEKELLFSKKI